jgi:hypothetical protein
MHEEDVNLMQMKEIEIANVRVDSLCVG